MKKWDVIEITWEDAKTEYESVNADKYVRNYKPEIRKTAGHFISRSDGRIFVAMENDSEGKDVGEEDCQVVTCIPLAMVYPNIREGIVVLSKSRRR